MESSGLLIADLKNIGSCKSALLNHPGTTAEITAPNYWFHPTDGRLPHLMHMLMLVPQVCNLEHRP